MCLAVPGKIIEAEERDGNRIAKVQFGGITRQAFLNFVPEAQVGDYVMVHVGFAISRVDAEEAARTYQLLEDMGLLEEEAGAVKPDGAANAVKYIDEYRDEHIVQSLAAQHRTTRHAPLEPDGNLRRPDPHDHASTGWTN